MTDALEIQRKKLKIRAWRRGFKEADLILGRFADNNLDAMGQADLDAYEHLLDQPDQDIYEWIIGRTPTPPEFETPVMARLREFRAHSDAAYGDGPKG
ncbi:FAD assembly factor SdhE [Maricaulis sp. CAU 1757]